MLDFQQFLAMRTAVYHFSVNPIGGAGPPALDLQEVSFTNGFYFFQRDSNGNGIARELLSADVVTWQQIFAPDNSIYRTLVGDAPPTPSSSALP